MTGRVDFYVFDGAAPQACRRLACRLTEKAYLRGMRVAILGQDADELRMLDELLWTFNDFSFVPHRICTGQADAEPATPVRLLHELPGGDATCADLLVNLSHGMPAQPERFTRIAEIVDGDPQRRRLGRERFKAYRGMQLTLETHQMDKTAEP
ncbi:MAG: DNA polymerase III subunit chi [Steroidobacterales bacterium]